MLDVVMKDPVTLAPAERVSLPEELVSVPTPSELTASEPEEAAQPEDFALVSRRRPLTPQGLPFCGQMSLVHPLQSRLTGP